MKIWVDDERPAPPGWRWCKTVAEASYYMGYAWGDAEDTFEALSLDHDLGEESTTMALIETMEHYQNWPSSIYVHTMNPVGRNNILTAVARSAPDYVDIYEVFIGADGSLPDM